MRLLAPSFLSVFLLAMPASAEPADADADDVGSDALVEKEHSMAIVMKGDHAELRVERTFHNLGASAETADLFFIAPASEAVAVGLRTLSFVDGTPRWLRGVLADVDSAAARYSKVAGFDGNSPGTAALLSWIDDGQFQLRVFPCPAGAGKTVGYTLLVPMHYSGGRHVLELTAPVKEKLAPTISVRATSERIWVDGKSASSTVKLDTAHTFAQSPTFDGYLSASSRPSRSPPTRAFTTITSTRLRSCRKSPNGRASSSCSTVPIRWASVAARHPARRRWRTWAISGGRTPWWR